MYDSIYDSIISARYVSIFILMAIFPSETVMPLVGYAAANNTLWLPGAVLVGSVGSTVGSVAVYIVARLVSEARFEQLISRYGRWVGITTRSVNKAGQWFDRNAAWTVFFGRFVPGVRTAVSVPAGLRGMPFLKFFAFTTLGSAACSSVLAYLGYIAQERIEQIHALIAGVSSFIYLFLLTLALAYIFWRLQKKK